MEDAFKERMKELDALLERCRPEEPFLSSVVRDTSNRSDRDWSWWSVQLERTHSDGEVHRRLIAAVKLDVDRDGLPGDYEAEWSVRAWRGVSADDYRRHGGWRLPWQVPSPDEFKSVFTALFAAAQDASDTSPLN